MLCCAVLSVDSFPCSNQHTRTSIHVYTYTHSLLFVACTLHSHNSRFGSTFYKDFVDYAVQRELKVYAIPFPDNATQEELNDASLLVEESNYKLVFTACLEHHFRPIVEALVECNVVHRHVLFFTGMDRHVFEELATFPVGSIQHRAASGMGLLQIEASSDWGSFSQSRNEDGQGRTGSGSIELIFNPKQTRSNVPTDPQDYVALWKASIQNQTVLDYFNTKLPTELVNQLSEEPSSNGAFLFDAVTRLGDSLCRLSSSDKTMTKIDGAALYDTFVNKASMEGVTGTVTLDPTTGTRVDSSVVYAMYNAVPDENPNSDNFHLVRTSLYEQGEWKDVPDTAFLYCDGTPIPPPDIPPIDATENKIGPVVQTIGYSLGSVVVVLSFGFIGWTLLRRKEKVVRASKPLFLYMVAFGAIMMGLSVAPFSHEEPRSTYLLDKACMGAPWLYLTGFSLAFSAMLTKTRHVYQVRTYTHICK